MLDAITPIILTYNEESNIGRVVERLFWAKLIVVVDSYSTDGTVDILDCYDNVQVFQRPFDRHADQWNYALHETGIETEWVLALDADYVLPPEFIDEIALLQPGSTVIGYMASFRYCVFGKPLRGTLYPPVTVLYRRNNGLYRQDGHTQRIEIQGNISRLFSPILHDDRKPLSAWLQAQDRYMELEAEMICNSSWEELSSSDKLRKLIVIAPFLVFIYCLTVKGGLLDGKAGLYYAMQRMVAELMLSLKLIQSRINNHGKPEQRIQL